MLLPLPNLDDRRWSDLAEEGRNLIPRYAPGWTDFNVHDPGITLVELLAWVTEMDVFRLNQIPESHRRKFLALLGITPRPPQAAQSVLQFSLNNGPDAVDLPASLEVETGHAEGPIRFRTLEALTIVPVELRALWRQDERGLHNLTLLWQNQEVLPIFGDVPAANSAFYFGLSGPLPPGRTLTLYLRFAGGKSGADERQRLQEEWLAARQDCPPPPNPCRPESLPAQALPAPPNLSHHSAHILWEFAQTAGSKISWRPLKAETGEVIDETRALTLDGFVRFTLPGPMAALTLAPPGPPLYYLRCRLAAGEYDAPPVLQAAFVNAVAAEQAIPTGTQFVIARGATITWPDDEPEPSAGSFRKFIPSFNQAGKINSLTFLPKGRDAPEFFITRWQAPSDYASGILGCEMQPIDTGLGEPAQAITLLPAPLQADSVEVVTLQDSNWQLWRRRPDFYASSRRDRHFHLDKTAGTVTFGDGEKGMPVPRGVPIFAKFHVTRADQGNVLAAQTWRLSNSSHNQALIDVAEKQARLRAIANPFPATGGAAAETLAHAEGRALQEVYRVTRAVTLADLEHLALATPGVHLARVAAKANVDARYPCLQAPGTVTVILLPQSPAPAAQPSPGLRAAVQRYLNRRRILGNRIEVVGPVYTKVTVRARVQSQTGVNAGRARQDILQALHDFFDPRRGGPEKTGWPFGRDVYRSEVLHTIDSVAGVEYVLALELIADDGEPSCGNLCLGPCGLVISGAHEIVVT